MRFSCPLWIRFRGTDLGLIWQTDDGTQTSDEDTDTVLVHDSQIATAPTSEGPTSPAPSNSSSATSSPAAAPSSPPTSDVTCTTDRDGQGLP